MRAGSTCVALKRMSLPGSESWNSVYDVERTHACAQSHLSGDARNNM